ncbi:capsid and scaffold protein [Streptococcus phage Javan249]|uniref:DUF4355 domain-containing protein n=1 Tax=Streptococcus halotolerans TaxID=1814128 RepID=UPI0007871DAA|nr:DUF4355 domain-containing protein [Streptococcus halotolerans]QBX16399.1 capsid and scaffold protein [Streptococcus phage Javan249]
MAEETNNTEVVENGTVDTPETTTEESKTFTQQELDDIVEARVARAVKKAQKDAEEQIQKAQSEGERLAKLSKDERNKEEQAKRLSELEKREHDLAMKELSIEARSLLSEEGLPAEFLNIVMADTAESVKDNISNLRTVFDEAVEKRVDERLTQSRVKTGSTAGAMSKQDIMAISDTNERQRLIAENMHLFKKG